ncbi:hypothetical protein ANCCAN_23529 [Ancylostoma caninum]|uniref:Uncharacterized protein n=1 Tax=Ancylostoma caninum TaxID=29170 RepID=A0A368FI85_ANCCA|nr:hypothetical protein ANCCAN_23529 [Ancylostoma caninum]
MAAPPESCEFTSLAVLFRNHCYNFGHFVVIFIGSIFCFLFLIESLKGIIRRIYDFYDEQLLQQLFYAVTQSNEATCLHF